MLSQHSESSWQQETAKLDEVTGQASSCYNVDTTSYTSSISSYYKQEITCLLPEEHSTSSSESESLNSEDEINTHDPHCYTIAFDASVRKLYHFNKRSKKSLQKSLDLWESLHTIGDSFINNAITYGRTIIKERNLPNYQKTIQPTNVGGVAGGEKFIVQGILFKFAKDQFVGNTWLYGGYKANDYLAAKGAGQELLSANYVGSYSSITKVPLMALIDYWGHRLIATALLPLKEGSLVYGSSDGGMTVVSNNSIVSDEMTSLGKEFHLQPHMVGSTSMALCGDIEVHECFFDASGEHKKPHYYCLDTARVFPPEYKGNLKEPQSIFYEKLRPEFVKNYEGLLCSDSFTAWQSQDRHSKEYNDAVVKATEYLHVVVIPSYIKELMQPQVIEELISSTSLYYILRWSNRDYIPNALMSHMHRYGINLRHLGRISMLLEQVNPKEAVVCSPEMLQNLKNYVHNVMTMRVIKNNARQTIRKRVTTEKEYKKTLLTIMNLLTTKQPELEEFWQKSVPALLQLKFGVPSSVQDSEKLHQGLLLLSFCQLLGIVLHPVCFNEFTKNYDTRMYFRFEESDIIEIRPTVKYLNYIDIATGFYALALSRENKEGDKRIALNCLQKAHDRLSTSLRTWCNPSHPILEENMFFTVDNIKKLIIHHRDHICMRPLKQILCDQPIYSLAVSPNGKTVVIGSFTVNVSIWDIETEKQLHKLPCNTKKVRAPVAYSPDGKTVLTGGDKTIMWDVLTGKELQIFNGESGELAVNSVAYSPDSKTILIGSDDRTAILWDVKTGERLIIFKHFGRVKNVAYSPDSKTILTGSMGLGDQVYIILWDATTGKQLREFTGHTFRWVLRVAYSPDSKTVLIGSRIGDSGTAIMWDALTGKQLHVFTGHQVSVVAVAYSPDSKTILIGHSNAVIMYDVVTGNQLRKFLGHEFASLAYCPDGKTILTGSVDQRMCVWSLLEDGNSTLNVTNMLKKRREFTGHTSSVASVIYSPDGKTILTGSYDTTAILWDVKTGEQLKKFKGHTDGIDTVAYSPDGKTILTSSSDESTILWDVKTGKQLLMFKGSSSLVASDGKSVLTASYAGKTAILWDIETGEQLRVFEGHIDVILMIAWSPDDKTILTSSLDNTAILWEIKTGKQLRVFTFPRGISSVKFSPDGKTILTGSFDDRTAFLWDIKTGKQLEQVFKGHTECVLSVAYSPDGKTILTGSDDRTAILWDIKTGKQLKKFKGHINAIWSVAYSPDGKTILTGSSDNTARLWKLSGKKAKSTTGKVSL